MKFVMYAAAVAMAIWQYVCFKELKQMMAVNWNNLLAEGVETKERFMVRQAELHEKYYIVRKKLTHNRMLLLRRFKWVFMDAVAVAVLHETVNIPEEWRGEFGFALMLFLTVSFMVEGDFCYDHILLDSVHKKEDYTEEMVSEFFDKRTESEDRVMPVWLLIGFRILRGVFALAAIVFAFL